MAVPGAGFEWHQSTGVAVEVKTGQQRASKFVLRQILKDAALVDGEQIPRVEWHFLANGDGAVEPDDRLKAFLNDPNTIPERDFRRCVRTRG